MLATPKPEATPSPHRHLCTASTAPPLFHCVLYRVFDLIPESMSNTSSAALQLDPEWPYWKSCEYKGIRVERCSDTIPFAASPWGVCDITGKTPQKIGPTCETADQTLDAEKLAAKLKRRATAHCAQMDWYGHVQWIEVARWLEKRRAFLRRSLAKDPRLIMMHVLPLSGHYMWECTKF